jgi:hypothetical protein
LEDDQLFLHWQERVLEQQGGSHEALRRFHLPTSADLYIRALHDWVNRYGCEPFPGEPLPPRQSRHQLMERYEAHTRHCRSCAGADRRLRQLQPLSWGMAAMAALAAAWLGPGLAGVVALLVAMAASLAGLRIRSWLRQLRYGSGLPPRNR